MRSIRQALCICLVVLSITAVIATAVYVNRTSEGQTGNSFSVVREAVAAQGKVKVSPVKARGDRGVYFPNTETLARNEMRIISLGTGMPNPRPSQKATCWPVELGNGDKFLFDLGTGSSDNLAALSIP